MLRARPRYAAHGPSLDTCRASPSAHLLSRPRRECTPARPPRNVIRATAPNAPLGAHRMCHLGDPRNHLPPALVVQGVKASLVIATAAAIGAAAAGCGSGSGGHRHPHRDPRGRARGLLRGTGDGAAVSRLDRRHRAGAPEGGADRRPGHRPDRGRARRVPRRRCVGRGRPPCLRPRRRPHGPRRPERPGALQRAGRRRTPTFGSSSACAGRSAICPVRRADALSAPARRDR